MADCKIEWKPTALREIERLDRPVTRRVLAAIESLRTNPLPPGVRPLRGGEHSYRIRVGDYRVVYIFLAVPRVVQIARVRHRKDAYR